MNPIEPITECGKRLRDHLKDGDAHVTSQNTENTPNTYCSAHPGFDRKLTKIITSLPFLADEVERSRQTTEKLEQVIRDVVKESEERTGAQIKESETRTNQRMTLMEKTLKEKNDLQDNKIKAQDKIIARQRVTIAQVTTRVGAIIGLVVLIGMAVFNKGLDLFISLFSSPPQ